MRFDLNIATWLVRFPASVYIVRAGERYPLGLVETPDSGRYALEALVDAGQHGVLCGDVPNGGVLHALPDGRVWGRAAPVEQAMPLLPGVALEPREAAGLVNTAHSVVSTLAGPASVAAIHIDGVPERVTPPGMPPHAAMSVACGLLEGGMIGRLTYTAVHGTVRLHVRSDRGRGDRTFWSEVIVQPHNR